ncbi:TIR domain-containing protein [Actinokineospora diospyrosa]|uniref:TIR domain-containing protein n=1 Tax=Actinokineospora diospyrosa TaxID=103728 RepID=A0ABT1II34_9PSEU|nr:TIR domain-containing protein [Actinokineospora diospyrosa]MCP2272308.1 TIR domain-containing protein [Actinokineospora diospyrosa]
MKVFISWSGEISRNVAEVLREWIPSVIQAVEPYLSSEDIDKGARWSSDISAELADCNFGIVCVTKDNLAAPWLNFEAGALSKFVETSRVSPFLFGVERKEVTGPLLQFQSTVYERDDVRKLINSINAACPLPVKKLDTAFDVWWPELDGKLREVSATPSANTVEKRSAEDLLGEVLDLVRAQHRMMIADSDQSYNGRLRTLRHHLADMRDLADSGQDLRAHIEFAIYNVNKMLHPELEGAPLEGDRGTVAVRRRKTP